MGTPDEAVMTGRLGRRSDPRRKYTIAEKRSMVEETQVRGASVSEVAQRHGQCELAVGVASTISGRLAG